MKNLLNDPDVMALYKGLQNNKYSDIDDYLTSTPIFERPSMTQPLQKQDAKFEPKLFFDGEAITDFIGDNDYGL